MDTYRRSSRKKPQLNVDLSTILYFVPYWIAAIAVVLILFMLAALVYIITPMTQNALPVISRVIVIAVEVAVAFFVGRQTSAPGLASGFIFGLGLTLIALIVGIFSGALRIFSLELILILFTGVLLGIFGAVAGKNANSKVRGKKSYLIK